VIRVLWFRFVVVVSTTFFSILGLLGGLLRAPPGLYDWIHRTWGRSILAAAGAKVVVEGLENSTPGRAQILVANHQSMLDIWALMAAIPASLRFVAKEELSRIPVFAAACRAAGHVFIDRTKAGQAVEAIRAAGERMREDGLTLVLFPEGTRSVDGSLGRFRRGAFALAIETRADLIPVAIEGGGRILGRGVKRVRPGTIRIRLAPPVPLAGLGAEDRDGLVEETRATVASMLGELGEPV